MHKFVLGGWEREPFASGERRTKRSIFSLQPSYLLVVERLGVFFYGIN